MKQEIAINKDILYWAIARAGYNVDNFTNKYPKFDKFLSGDKYPTIKQLEDFAKKVYIPFGYLFLPEPPKETLPIPFFRTEQSDNDIGVNVYDTILLLQQRQSWLKDYLIDNDFPILPFVGKYKDNYNVDLIVDDIRSTLNLQSNWASSFKTWEESLSHLTNIIEDNGIITVFNGIVENNTHRAIPVSECRGFVLVDTTAPFMFINNADFKAAQMFTIIHELAHIWTGHSAGFDFRKMQPANNAIEILCDKVAAEFLVPSENFSKIWKQAPNNLKYLSRYFKVSEIVIARRALDLKKWTKQEFFIFYDEYKTREFIKKENMSSGGDFYATAKKRLSLTFAAHVKQAVTSGQLLYRDAYKLTSMKGDTFDKFINKTF